MADNDSLTIIAKVVSIILGALGFVLVNNRFVLARSETQCKAVIAAFEARHAKESKEDRKEMFEAFAQATKDSEGRLKEHMTLLIKADKVDTFNQSRN